MKFGHLSKIVPLARDMNSTGVHFSCIHPRAVRIFHPIPRYQLQDDIRYSFNRYECITGKMSHQVRVLREERGFDYARADSIHTHTFSEELFSDAAGEADDGV